MVKPLRHGRAQSSRNEDEDQDRSIDPSFLGSLLRSLDILFELQEHSAELPCSTRGEVIAKLQVRSRHCRQGFDARCVAGLSRSADSSLKAWGMCLPIHLWTQMSCATNDHGRAWLEFTTDWLDGAKCSTHFSFSHQNDPLDAACLSSSAFSTIASCDGFFAGKTSRRHHPSTATEHIDENGDIPLLQERGISNPAYSLCHSTSVISPGM